MSELQFVEAICSPDYNLLKSGKSAQVKRKIVNILHIDAIAPYSPFHFTAQNAERENRMAERERCEKSEFGRNTTHTVSMARRQPWQNGAFRLRIVRLSRKSVASHKL